MLYSLQVTHPFSSLIKSLSLRINLTSKHLLKLGESRNQTKKAITVTSLISFRTVQYCTPSWLYAAQQVFNCFCWVYTDNINGNCSEWPFIWSLPLEIIYAWKISESLADNLCSHRNEKQKGNINISKKKNYPPPYIKCGQFIMPMPCQINHN